MKKLLKAYGFNSDMQYFEMIVTSFENGQNKQACEQFSAMPKKDRVAFLKSATIGGWVTMLNTATLNKLFDLI